MPPKQGPESIKHVLSVGLELGTFFGGSAPALQEDMQDFEATLLGYVGAEKDLNPDLVFIHKGS